MLTILVLLVAAAAATAQTPIPLPIGECSTGDATEVTAAGGGYGQSEFVIPPDLGIVVGVAAVPGSLCSAYAHAGWEETMQLHLGEGAEDYLPLIERAVEVWNETVNLPTGEPLIEIAEASPENYLLPESFWLEREQYGVENLDDNESVIYFKPARPEDGVRLWGLTWYEWELSDITSSPEMIKADVYINTNHEEKYAPATLILTKKIADVDSTYGAYALYNKTYSVILHELGHAVGLGHIPVNGNVMGRDFGAGGLDQWSAPIALELFNALTPRQNKFVFSHSQMAPYTKIGEHNEELHDLVNLFTENAKLGEQEKTALACIYQY